MQITRERKRSVTVLFGPFGAGLFDRGMAGARLVRLPDRSDNSKEQLHEHRLAPDLTLVTHTYAANWGSISSSSSLCTPETQRTRVLCISRRCLPTMCG